MTPLWASEKPDQFASILDVDPSASMSAPTPSLTLPAMGAVVSTLNDRATLQADTTAALFLDLTRQK